MLKRLLEKPLNDSEIKTGLQHKWDKVVVCVFFPAAVIFVIWLLKS